MQKQSVQTARGLGLRYLGVERARLNLVPVLKGVNLIFYERHQRRYHDGETRQHNTRQLIAQALPRPSRHQHKHVLSHDGRIHDLLLLVAIPLQRPLRLKRAGDARWYLVVEGCLAHMPHVITPIECALELQVPANTLGKNRFVAPQPQNTPSSASSLPLCRRNKRWRNGIILKQIPALFERRAATSSP